MSEKNLQKLNSKWTIWFHKSDDNNWDFDSYIKLVEFDSIEEYSVIMNTFKPSHIQNALLFVMRNDIKPMWEAEENKNGGCISFKIYRNYIYDSWKQLNRLLKEYYLDQKFLTIDGPVVGSKLLEIKEIFLCPKEDNNHSFELEGSIFQSVCHHPVQWVREFVEYGLVQPLQNGSAKTLDQLRNDYGIDYQIEGDRVEVIFN